jgi:hypothetical protein
MFPDSPQITEMVAGNAGPLMRRRCARRLVLPRQEMLVRCDALYGTRGVGGWCGLRSGPGRGVDWRRRAATTAWNAPGRGL